MDSGAVYIPMDRRQALAHRVSLPERTNGAALFADISGFTPLTEALTRDLGVRRGPEELTNSLNLVYTALIADLNHYGGSTISFAGDAITCWFDDRGPAATSSDQRDPGDPPATAALRAVACALAMQHTMQQFAQLPTPSGGTVELAMKAGIAVGPVRRFTVGDPQIQRIDILAGATLDQVAEAEHQAERGEVVLAEATAALIGGALTIETWRTDGKQRFVVVAGLQDAVAPAPWPPSPTLDEPAVREWLLPPVYERLRQGMGDFLAELRPAVALFLRFDGLDYDSDSEAADRLDSYVRMVQAVLARYDSYIMQITIGDKGNMLYAAFGAPTAHEDDAIRACAAALEIRGLRSPGISNVQIGISQGRMRTGAYGSTTRRTYGVLGDEVNLAARLMQASRPGQILASGHVCAAAADQFAWEVLPAIRVKGKRDLIEVFELRGTNERSTAQIHTTRYALPMIGRERELARVDACVNQALAGTGQIIGITGATGMGKSRMLAEVVRLASGQGFQAYLGECQSYGIHSSYHAWHRIGRSLFAVDPHASVRTQIASITAQLVAIDPLLEERLPLLDTLLGVSIPDNELTRYFDARLRKASLEALMVDVLRARAQQAPLLLVVEDGHWLDPLSHDLLAAFALAISDLPVLMVVTYRPPEESYSSLKALTSLQAFTEVALGDFDADAVEQLIRAKLVQFTTMEAGDADVPQSFIDEIARRGQGNPFYVEELLNYLNDHGISPTDVSALGQMAIPDTLERVLLSRIDQLTEREKTVLKIASVIGRVFQAAVLWGAYPEFGNQQHVRDSLSVLVANEFTQLESPDPELAYLFRHILTQEAAYESLPYATRETLHEQIALFIERVAGEQIEQQLDLLAFHYDRSRNSEKRREYLLRAGEAAQANYANAAAVDYYQRALPLFDDTRRVAIIHKLGRVLELIGNWESAQGRYTEGLTLAEQLADRTAQARYQMALGDLLRKQGRYAEAATWLSHASALYAELNDLQGQAGVLNIQGVLADLQGEYTKAQEHYLASLALWTRLDDQPQIGKVFLNLGAIARLQGDNGRAREFAEASLSTQRAIGDRLWVAYALNNLGNVALDEGGAAAAQTYLEEALSLMRQVGEKWMIGNILNNLANVVRTRSDYPQAHTLYRESLLIYRDFADRWALAYLLEDVGALAALEGRADGALQLIGAASLLRESINAPLSAVEQSKLDALLAPAHEQLGPAGAGHYQSGRALSLEEAIQLAIGE